jgi:hypothetical protein
MQHSPQRVLLGSVPAIPISLGDGRTQLLAVGVGEVVLPVPGRKDPLVFVNVLCISAMATNLVSTVQATRRGWRVVMEDNHCSLQHGGVTRAEAVRRGDHYHLVMAGSDASLLATPAETSEL